MTKANQSACVQQGASKSKTGSNAKAKQQPKAAKFDARIKARRALQNARARCNNVNHPDYAKYGGQGVKVLLVNVDELIASAGLPNPNQSFDRINPHGHYEAGNVRWASAAVQAANKKLSPSNKHLTAFALSSQAKEAKANREQRRGTSAAWVKAIDAHNFGALSESKLYLFENYARCEGVLAATFDFTAVPDQVNIEPGTIHLPALSLPQSRIRLRALPGAAPDINDRLNRRGLLRGLKFVDINQNAPKPIQNKVAEIIENRCPGLIVEHQTNQQDLLGGGIEGVFLALASHFSFGWNIGVAVKPLTDIAVRLRRLDRMSDLWLEPPEPVLDAQILFIPDLALNCGRWGDFPADIVWSCQKLFEYRLERGFVTIVGVQSFYNVPKPIAECILPYYTYTNLPQLKPHTVVKPEFCGEHFPVYVGSTCLRGLANAYSTSWICENSSD